MLLSIAAGLLLSTQSRTNQALGALVVFSQATAIALVGAALFTVCLVTVQCIGSMAMDRIGFGGAPPRKISALRLLDVLAPASLAGRHKARAGSREKDLALN